MSDIMIGVVAEGKTDHTVIKAALVAILPNHRLTVTRLQPEESDAFGGFGATGGGWPGVFRWCQQLLTQGGCSILERYDLVIVHLDAEVARENYSNAGIVYRRKDLPCTRPCPPATATVDVLRNVCARWLGYASATALPRGWVLCIPAQVTEAWVIPALYADSKQQIPRNLECHDSLIAWLSARPAKERTLVRGRKKQPAAYRAAMPTLRMEWSAVCARCTQAQRFTKDILSAV